MFIDLGYIETGDSAFWMDETVIDQLEILVENTAKKYNVKIDSTRIFCDRLYIDFFETRYPKTWRKARTLMHLRDLEGEIMIKERSGVKKAIVDNELLEKIQLCTSDEWAKVVDLMYIKQGFGYEEDGREKRIEELAKHEEQEEKKHLKTKIREYTLGLKGTGATNPRVKTISDDGGAFMYDILYCLKHNFGVDIDIRWSDPPDVALKPEKKKIIAKYLL